MDWFSRAYASVGRKIKVIANGVPQNAPVLEMIFRPECQPPSMINARDGYRVRQFRHVDRERYLSLVEAAGLPRFSLEYWEDRLLEDGFFILEHEKSGSLAASCMAAHRPAARHPRGGTLGWLAVDPVHRGMGLGAIVSACVTARLVNAGYRRIYLETHDFRLPAIRIYLSLGWVPLLYLPEMTERWRAICEQLEWPFTPEAWCR